SGWGIYSISCVLFCQKRQPQTTAMNTNSTKISGAITPKSCGVTTETSTKIRNKVTVEAVNIMKAAKPAICGAFVTCRAKVTVVSVLDTSPPKIPLSTVPTFLPATLYMK